jgi:hypothetical protein
MREGRNVMSRGEPSAWTFLTNHAHVLVCIAEDPETRGRDIAEKVGITERAAQSIIADLVTDGYVSKFRDGRRNRYAIHPDAPLRHPLESDHTIGELLVTLGRLRPKSTRRPTSTARTPPGVVAKRSSAKQRSAARSTTRSR